LTTEGLKLEREKKNYHLTARGIEEPMRPTNIIMTLFINNQIETKYINSQQTFYIASIPISYEFRFFSLKIILFETRSDI
jgi:hypothetical protein